MLRFKYRDTNPEPQRINLKTPCTIINILPSGVYYNNNNIQQKSFLKYNNNQTRSNKFLPIPERQRIIREINESKNQIDLHINLYGNLNKNKVAKKESENKNMLYIKKTKSALNLLDKTPIKKTINNKNVKKSQNSKIDIKFTDNRKLVNNAIKEYYKKMDNSFKNYLQTINDRFKDNKIKKSQRNNKNQNNNYNYNISYINNSNKSIINNNNLYTNKNNDININNGINEIYKKPNLGKVYSKVNINSITEENSNPNQINNNQNIKNKNNGNNNGNTFINLDKLCLITSARREKINCAKMINNGLTKNIFNKINNYNTTTFRNSNLNENVVKTNINNSNNNKDYLKKNNSSSNFIVNNNYKRKNRINEIITTTEMDIKNKDNKNDLLNNIKYIKKNIKSPENIQNKKNTRLFKSNFMSNDIPKIIIDNDIISLIPSDIQKKENVEIIYLQKNKDKEKEKITLNEDILHINNEIKNKNQKVNKCLTFSLKETPNKEEEKKNKSFSYSPKKIIVSEKEKIKVKTNNISKNYVIKNGRYHFKYKNNIKNNGITSPSYKEKFKFKLNYINNRNKALLSKDVFFNKKNKSYFKTDDDALNSDKNSFIDNNRSYDNRKISITSFGSNIDNNYFNINKSPMKEYYLNYFSNKINNDFLDENKFNKFEIEILKKNSKKRNSDILNSINKNRNNTPLKTLLRTYCPTTVNSNNKNEKAKTILNNYYSENNTKENNYLKTDVSNDKKNSRKINRNLNNDSWAEEQNCQTSTKTENNDVNNNINKNNYNSNNNGVNDNKTININNLKKEENKDKEINRIKNIITSDKLKVKVKEINLSNNKELIFKDKNINNDSKTRNVISKIELKKEEEEEKEEDIDLKNNDKINDILEKEKIINNETKDEVNDSNIIKLNNYEEPIKPNYINKRYKNSFSLDLIEYINIISPNNYSTIKNNILNLITHCDIKIKSESLFVDILYPIAIKQTKYQPIYAKLFKDLDKYYNKKDKAKSIIRTQLIKFCKANFRKIKICIENINNIVNDINFIGELINVQMVSKKVGLQCLTHLLSRFNQFNEDVDLKDKKEEKYLYLKCYINLLNKFATCVKIYQKIKIRQDELEWFENEINNNINIIKEIMDNKANKDMPYDIKNNLVKLIDKSKNNWEISVFEKYKNDIFSFIYDEYNYDNNSKNVKSFEIFNSFDDNDYDSIPNFYKKENILDNKNKQFKSVSPINYKIDYNNSSFHRGKQRLSSNQNNKIHKISKVLSEYSKKFEKNLSLFKNHIDKYNRSDNFNDWNEIDNFFFNKKIRKLEIFKGLIEACKFFVSKKEDMYYIDIYIKIIFEYYYNYLNETELNEIINILLNELSLLTDEELKKEENQFIINIWIIIIYYLLQNKIITFKNFNYFCKNYYTKEIKKNILNILNEVCLYNKDNKKYYYRELMNTKFANINKKILSEVQNMPFIEN